MSQHLLQLQGHANEKLIKHLAQMTCKLNGGMGFQSNYLESDSKVIFVLILEVDVEDLQGPLQI